MNAKIAKRLRKKCEYSPTQKRLYEGGEPPMFASLPNNGGWIKVRKGVPQELVDPSPRYFYRVAKRKIKIKAHDND